MPQLELGITPLKIGIKIGLTVAFFVDVKRSNHCKKREVHVGIVKWHNGSRVVVKGITIPGIYNRAAEKLFEVHKNMSLDSWVQP